jgi:hypothetical protein
VSISSLEVETRFAVRRASTGGFDYIIRTVPLAVVRNNPTAEAEMGPVGWRMSLATPRGATLGFGLKPLGFGQGQSRTELQCPHRGLDVAVTSAAG